MCSCCFVPHPTSTSICLHSCVCACVFLLVPSGSVPSPSPLFWLYTWERLLGAALGPETWMKQTFISHESTVLPDLFYFVLSFVSLFFFEWPKSSCRESQSSFIPWSLLLWICSLWCTLKCSDSTRSAIHNVFMLRRGEKIHLQPEKIPYKEWTIIWPL